MNKIIFITLVAIALYSCETKQQKKQHLKDSLQVDSDIKKGKADSLDGLKAIGNIKFGINEKDFEIQSALFKKSCRDTSSQYSTYSIGDFTLDTLSGSYYKNKLYMVTLSGVSLTYEQYDALLIPQAEALIKVVKAKYGEPAGGLGIPSWSSIEKGYYRKVYIWDIGDKEIDVSVQCEGSTYYPEMHIFQKSISDKIEQEEKERADSIANKAKTQL